MILIDGKKIASEIKAEIAIRVAQLDKKPCLAAVIVGADPASETYVAAKERACKDVGVKSEVFRLKEEVSEVELVNLIEKLNSNDEITGFIVQLPLPKHIDTDRILMKINPDKDVDGFHPLNLGKMLADKEAFLPATPFGIVQLLERYNIETSGKDCVIIGRSNIVGSPLAVMLSRKKYNCTVTLCHRKTTNIVEKCHNADILIAAIGQPHFVKAEMVKEGAVVVDVGIHRVPDDSEKGYRIIGDVDFDNVAPKTSFITPVPGGVGAMTVVSLLQNVLMAAEK